MADEAIHETNTLRKATAKPTLRCTGAVAQSTTPNQDTVHNNPKKDTAGVRVDDAAVASPCNPGHRKMTASPAISRIGS